VTEISSESLIDAARKLARPFRPSNDVKSGGVASALVTTSGNVYTGICIDTACSMGFCAEHSAIAEMLKNQESEIKTIVAVDDEGIILAPCGRCRELIWQVNRLNADTVVLLSNGRTKLLGELLPERWNEERD
jgi:cytidine deaminase